MPDNPQQAIREILERATRDAEALQARMEAGEHVSEEEMTGVARRVAEAIEEANRKLRDLVGLDSALLREKMVENMTPEEFEEWSEDNAALMRSRADKKESTDG